MLEKCDLEVAERLLAQWARRCTLKASMSMRMRTRRCSFPNDTLMPASAGRDCDTAVFFAVPLSSTV
jgi:hypothetical protein